MQEKLENSILLPKIVLRFHCCHCSCDLKIECYAYSIKLSSKVTLATKKLLKMLEQSVIRCNGYGETFLYAETI